MEFFASIEVERLYPFGDQEFWIEVKRDLTAGEEKQITGAAFRRASRSAEDGESSRLAFDLDYGLAAFTKVAAYLKDWNLPGPDGKTVDIASSRTKADALRNLKPAVFAAIEQAIDTFVLARREEKKVPAGPKKSKG